MTYEEELLGTGGTLMGTGERLRESFPDVVVAAVGVPGIVTPDMVKEGAAVIDTLSGAVTRTATMTQAASTDTGSVGGTS